MNTVGTIPGTYPPNPESTQVYVTGHTVGLLCTQDVKASTGRLPGTRNRHRTNENLSKLVMEQ